MPVRNDATVLAFERKLTPSNGYLYGTTWDNRSAGHFFEKALTINSQSLRGSLSNRLKPEISENPEKFNEKVTKANLKKIDICYLEKEHDTLKLVFSLKVLSGVEEPAVSNGQKFNASYPNMAKAYIEQYGFEELAKRYAINIVNGRYLWRNRKGAMKTEVVVYLDNQKLVFNPHDYQLNDFNENNDNLCILSNKIADALCGRLPYLLIKVEAFALIGEAQEVYPSIELIIDRKKSEQDLFLYHSNGTAALHPQKIGNAIRTIDTWYPGHDDPNVGIGPIAIEPYGAVTTIGKAFRSPKDNADFYSLFDRFALGEQLAKNDQHYVMAVLLRGGVFGMSGKE